MKKNYCDFEKSRNLNYWESIYNKLLNQPCKKKRGHKALKTRKH